MNTIAEQWQFFETTVISPDAPPLQRQEMCRAFYSGAEALLRIQHKIGDPGTSIAAGVAIIEGIQDELRSFAAMVANGKA